MEILAISSPLKCIPEAICPKDRILLDSIRYCAEIVGVSYSRLLEELTKVSNSSGDISQPFAPLLSDAWSIIDATHRLTKLARVLVPETPELQMLNQKVNDVKTARNCIQHLKERIDLFVNQKMLALGFLTWVTALEDEPGAFKVHSIAPGSLNPDQEVPSFNPLGRRDMIGTLDFIQLHLPGTAVDIRLTIEAVIEFIRYLEILATKQFDGLGGNMADIYFSYELRKASEKATTCQRP